jgi:hypothetical protein
MVFHRSVNLYGQQNLNTLQVRPLVKNKAKFTQEQAMKAKKGSKEAQLYFFFNLDARWGGGVGG